MDGEGFEIHVKQGDQVNIGDPLLTFNLDLVKRKAASHITPVIVTNGDILSSLKRTKDNTVVAGETTILELTLSENELKNGNEGGETEREKSEQQRSIYSVEAAKIVAAVGGLDNINAATHCVTRLRFALVDESIVDKDALDNLDLVKGTFITNGQYQIVIGQGTVDRVYKRSEEHTSELQSRFDL